MPKSARDESYIIFLKMSGDNQVGTR